MCGLIKRNEIGRKQDIRSNYLKSSNNKDFILFVKVASTKIWVIKLDVLGPIRSILGHG